jgi:hypothetical protein
MLPEFSRRQLLTEPPQAGVEEVLEATPAECAALAERFGIEALHHFSARFTRKPYPGGGLLLSGRIKAETVQLCVVSLDPVIEHLDKPFTLVVLAPEDQPSEDPDGPDEIETDATGHFDLGEALVRNCRSRSILIPARRGRICRQAWKKRRRKRRATPSPSWRHCAVARAEPVPHACAAVKVVLSARPCSNPQLRLSERDPAPWPFRKRRLRLPAAACVAAMKRSAAPRIMNARIAVN